MNEKRYAIEMPTAIIFPNSITGLISLNVREIKAAIVVATARKHGNAICIRDV